jgi:trans-2,3-dihydro-3-hydroxyanthranilate isomerase
MAIELRYRVVDVFSDRPLAGNAVCVVLDPCPEPVMGAIAREVNLSETTFPTVVGDDEYEVRIFTPMAELPFAGHPSLGTAWVLGRRRWTQVSEGATVVVEADEDGAVMCQPTPEISEAPMAWVTNANIEGAEGAYRAEAGGVAHLLVPTSTRLDRLRATPAAFAEVAQKARATTVGLFARQDDSTLKVRVFVPGPAGPGGQQQGPTGSGGQQQGPAGPGGQQHGPAASSGGGFEDPGTGSAAGPIALLACRLWGTSADVIIRQGDEVGRPCRIEVHAEEGDVRVGGSVAACAEGTFTL